MRRELSCRDVKDCRAEFARDLLHVGDHQQQPLRCGERGRQGTGLERPVDRAGGAGFTLHFHHRGNGVPEILHPSRRPLVGPFAHGRRGGDGVNRDDFAELIGDVGYGFVGIERLKIRRLHPLRSIRNLPAYGKASLGKLWAEIVEVALGFESRMMRRGAKAALRTRALQTLREFPGVSEQREASERVHCGCCPLTLQGVGPKVAV